ncbi:MAG: hypothetical protein BRD55_08610 [Bacteroidetes bacterium SW_9_63_38]|nr:MAG: hypothetical protein BRD55_08610 [Bacteroidetes bacterium SW_9_63_38]
MKKIVRKVARGEEPSDASYWREQPPEERLAALEQIRQEYHGWTDDTVPRLQRVYSVVERT